MIGGVDFSKYQAGITADAIRQAIQAQGPVVTIQAFRNDGPNEHVADQLVAAQVAGTNDLSIYTLLNFERADWPGQVQVDMSLAEAAKGIDIPRLLFVAIDIEPYPALNPASKPFRIPRTIEAVRRVRERGLYPIIYTNKGAWETVMAGTPQDWGLVVNDTELWMATMDHTPDMGAVWKAQPWGAVDIVGEQYEAGKWGGYDFDQNVWSDSFIALRRAERDQRLAPPPQPTPTPTPVPVPVPTPLPAEDLTPRVVALEALAIEGYIFQKEFREKIGSLNTRLTVAEKRIAKAAEGLVA